MKKKPKKLNNAGLKDLLYSGGYLTLYGYDKDYLKFYNSWTGKKYYIKWLKENEKKEST